MRDDDPAARITAPISTEWFRLILLNQLANSACRQESRVLLRDLLRSCSQMQRASRTKKDIRERLGEALQIHQGKMGFLRRSIENLISAVSAVCRTHLELSRLNIDMLTKRI